MSMSVTARVAPIRRRPASWPALLWTAPALCFYALFALFPLLVAVYLSFTNWNGIAQAVWIGPANWLHFFSDPLTLHAIGLTVEMMILTWVLQTPLSLLLGVFMAGQQRYRAVLSVFYFLPLLFSTVAIGITWVSILDPNFGLINVALRALGLSSWARGWLGDPGLAFYVVAIVIAWQFIPFHSLLYMTGARQIPRELYDVAEIDGAGRLRKFFSITLPQLKYTIITSSIFMLTGSLTYFDLIWVMTGGGPGYATRILPLHMYITAFMNEQVGYGSVIALVLAISGIALSLLLLRVTGFLRMSSQLEGL
ncbi:MULTISPECIES: sugar ABC transporter permease [Thermogemmatispora]|jgi:raffinose/stachyose/melibiose transport system permease protein|uniref:carbohydrate ABC transporter permease n=1 Tax=Thermogemmatispora TaxID=768669 RepID=UPI001D134C00|nr:MULTISPECIES: sugar ABC transporter permease [Thermogemmatispora]